MENVSTFFRTLLMPLFIEHAYISFVRTPSKKRAMKKDYLPQPVDTADVKLPEALLALAEEIAKNVHEVWSEGRMKEGWTFGEKRDDALKHHPCLVPYEELSESEKEYDRNTAQETLKLIVKLGFKISKDN